jgi:hypothetical protein
MSLRDQLPESVGADVRAGGQPGEQPGVAKLRPGDRLTWRGRRAEVADVAEFVDAPAQIVLRFLDKPGLPVSLPADDLAGAEVWRFQGSFRPGR